MRRVKVVDWFSWRDIEEIFPTLAKVPQFKHCDLYTEAPYDEAHKKAIIKDIIKHNYIIYGDTHQAYDHNCVPVCNDGYITLSMRAWGDLMAQAMNIKEKTNKYDYRDFYMSGLGCHLDEKIPYSYQKELTNKE